MLSAPLKKYFPTGGGAAAITTNDYFDDWRGAWHSGLALICGATPVVRVPDDLV
jgi:hypothetical protein